MSCQICGGKKELTINEDIVKCPLCRKSKVGLITIDTIQMSVIDELCSALLMAIERKEFGIAHCLANIIDCLPEYNVTAILLCEMYNIPSKYVDRIRKVFGFGRKFI